MSSRPNTALIHARLPDQPWRELVSGLGYTVGFFIVILGRQQLFTENTLTPILPLLHRREAAVFAANMLGAFLFAQAIAASGMFDASDMAVLLEGSHKGTGTPSP